MEIHPPSMETFRRDNRKTGKGKEKEEEREGKGDLEVESAEDELMMPIDHNRST